MNDESSLPGNSIKKKSLFGRIYLLVIILLFLFIAGNIYKSTDKRNLSTSDKNTELANNAEFENQENVDKTSGEVLGRNSMGPALRIYGGQYNYSNGGLIALASTDEPSIELSTYGVEGKIEISMYQADETAMLDYLSHDKNGEQIKKSPDQNKLKYVTSVNVDPSSSTRITLPFDDIGIWYLRAKTGKTEVDAFVIRSNVGAIAMEGDNEFIFWGQNFKTRRSVTDGNIKLLSLLDGVKELQTVSFNAEGIAKAKMVAEADVALIIQNDDRAVIPVNLKYLNSGYLYSSFKPKQKITRYFVFTDRPLYQPGDTVYFKAILRDDDDARYSIPQGTAEVKIYNDYYYNGIKIPPLFEKNYSVSADGTINGEYKLPADAKTGNHSLTVGVPDQNGEYWDPDWTPDNISFEVEFFRKPEYSIDVVVPQTEFMSGDKLSFQVRGSYFSGQPLAGQNIKYRVTASDFYEYEYAMDQEWYGKNIDDRYRYNYWYGSNNVTEGSAILDNSGQAEIELNTKVDFNQGRSQIFSVEASVDSGAMEPSFARKNILVFAGEYGIYRKDYRYGVKVNTALNMPLVIIPNRANKKVDGLNLTAKIRRIDWVSYQEENQKYLSYKQIEEDLPSIQFKSDNQGNANLSFVPTKTGAYNIKVEGVDSRGNIISKTFYTYVSSEDYPYYTHNGNSDLTIEADKLKYEPNDTARLSIFSTIPNRDVFLSLERGRVNRFQIVRMEGKNAIVNVPLVDTDVPNIYANVLSFSTYTLDRNNINLSISSEDKKLMVNITPNATRYRPGETATINISTTDVKGNPVPAEVALWSVDKALYELSDSKLGDIFSIYWKERSNSTMQAHSLEGIYVNTAEMGGCFVKETPVLMADGKYKNIDEIKTGEYVFTRTEDEKSLVKAKVLSTHKVIEDGYVIINSNLKVTPNHIMWVNNNWKEAGSIQNGDKLIDSSGKDILVESVEWQRAKVEVYNLEIEKYHTYFAGGVWVHNEKGGTRQIFKDTAYWNPVIQTDINGRAQVSFKLPDNLTTWALAAVGTTQNTKVGQTTSEIIVSKDVVIRPIVPNLMRTGDDLVLSALVQNFSPNQQTLDVKLDFDAGDVENAVFSDVVLETGKMEQFYWKIKPTRETNTSKLTFSAGVKGDVKLNDAVVLQIPVKPFGFVDRRAEVGEGDKTYQISLATDSNKEQSSVVLSLSPTVLGTLPTAMKYLIEYPYGCVEQTTSRFVPVVIAKVNSGIFTEALIGKDIDDMIKTGLGRLANLQQNDGGWAWWYTGNSDPYITAYVMDYVGQVKKLGFEVDENMWSKAVNYFTAPYPIDPVTGKEKLPSKEDLVAMNYGLMIIGNKDSIRKIEKFDNLSSDLLSLAVMTNYELGDKNPETNGLNKLISMAQTQGESLYWDTGSKLNFGSVDASTALAIRAILTAGGDRELATKGVRYITRNRKNEYWSNTFATAQVIRAVVDYSNSDNELNPNYSYTVSLDGKKIAQGMVNNSKQVVKDIVVPTKDLQLSSNLEVTKTGQGQMYSTLSIKEFHTDRSAAPVSKGLSVVREYVNEKGSEYSLGVGDVAVVNITVSGLGMTDYYGLIEDELPAGMVPINQAFNNQQFDNSNSGYYFYDGVMDREITQNGITLSVYQMPAGSRTFTYKARIVSEGNFIVPPAKAMMMYAPEISGRSSVQTIKIDKESIFTPRPVSVQKRITAPLKNIVNKAVDYHIEILITLVLLISLIVPLGRARGWNLERIISKLKRHKEPVKESNLAEQSSVETSSLNNGSENEEK